MRELRWAGGLNVRDLGGLPLAGGGETRFGAVVRSAYPGLLADDGWRALLAHGVRTIVDLRCPSERPYVLVDGLRRVAVPIFRFDDDELGARLRGFDETGDYYRVWIDYCRSTFAAAVGAVADAPQGGVLLHCQAGRDRTGVVTALMLALVDVPDDAIVDDYAASEPPLRTFFVDPEDAACVPDSLRSLLADLRAEHGSVREYLLSAGATPAQLERVRERLVG